MPRARKSDDPSTRRILGRLKKARERLGLSQARVAERAGVEVSYVGLVERHQRIPTLPVLFRLAAAVDIAPEDLLSEATLQPRRDFVEVEEIRAMLASWPPAQRRALLRMARELDRVRAK